MTEKLLRDDPSEYYPYHDYFTPEITFYLITLDENGSFVCRSGGEELAAEFHKGYDAPALHPLSYHLTDLKDNVRYMHVTGISQ